MKCRNLFHNLLAIAVCSSLCSFIELALASPSGSSLSAVPRSSPALASSASIAVNWRTTEAKELVVKVQGHDEILDACAESGVEVRYRYQIRLCRGRSWWFDRCQDEQRLSRSFQFDPISEDYEVKSDQYGDGAAPQSTRVNSASAAFNLISTVDNLPISLLERDELVESSSKSYLGVRVLADCRNDSNLIAKRISTIVTLGLVQVGSFDSGWVDFEFKNN